MFDDQQWFKQDDLWHAFRLSAPDALCGETKIVYGVDPISNFVPSGGQRHGACVAAVAGVDPTPEPAPEPKSLAKRSKRSK